jgi:hypothetical protein
MIQVLLRKKSPSQALLFFALFLSINLIYAAGAEGVYLSCCIAHPAKKALKNQVNNVDIY